MGKSKHPLIYISLAMLPMILSLSFGVLGALLMALLMGMVLFHKKLPKVSALYASIAVMSMLLLLGFALWLWPDNPISIRLENIFSGKDTSANGRLFDSFMFANDMISTQSAWLGVGPGQVKILAHDMIIDHYKYTGELAEVVRIPNSMGEMLAIYGWYGFILKIALEIFFFIRLKIYQNIYSFSLFVFIFIYQFTGSFLMNIAEIGIWAIVFQGRFQSFSNSKKPNEL